MKKKLVSIQEILYIVYAGYCKLSIKLCEKEWNNV